LKENRSIAEFPAKYVSRYGELDGQTDFCMDDGQLGTRAGWVADGRIGEAQSG